MFQRRPNSDDFETLLAPHLKSAYLFACQLTKNDADAEDVLQDACQQAFARFHQFQKGTNFKAWLFRIIRNLYIDRLRRKQREPALEDLRRHYPVQVDVDVLDEIHRERIHRKTAGLGGKEVLENEAVFDDLFGDEVNRFLGELPAEFRVALLLCDLEGFSYQEIGEILECPIGTVRSRISRARSYLKEKLFQYARNLGYVRETGD